MPNMTTRSSRYPRWRPDHVREFVDLLYLNLTYGIGERMYYALHRRKNPYQAKYVDSKARWPPLIDCGHNPFLMAHLVEDLQVETHDDWTETATWRDVRLVKKRTEEWANPPKVSHLLKLFAEARYHRMFTAIAGISRSSPRLSHSLVAPSPADYFCRGGCCFSCKRCC